MPIISCYCKKGGVGKTTFIGYLSHYYANLGKSVLLISADDQNSVFKIFGAENFVTEKDDDFLENLLIGEKLPENVVFEARDGMYLMKTLNTDRLSMDLTLKRSEEKKLRGLIESFQNYFDYIFIDFPPSSSRLTEILLDLSEKILVVVGLDALGVDGYKNTIQYFVDADINIDKIAYVIPIGYNVVKIVPNKCLKELKDLVQIYTPKAIITSPIKEKSEIKNLQAEGLSVFDDFSKKDKFHKNNCEAVKTDMTGVFKEVIL